MEAKLLTQVAQAQDAAAVSDDDDLHAVREPVVHDLPEAPALAEGVKVHAQRLPAQPKMGFNGMC